MARSDARTNAAVDTRPLTVKVLPPKSPPWFLRRPALERKLDRAAAHRLTAVIAGAGFGKSTQVAGRAQARGWAWYTADASDRSAGVLARGLTGALRRRVPLVTDPVVPAGVADNRVAADALAGALAHELDAELAGELVLVVDDVHELGRDTPGLQLLEGFIRYAPPSTHLVLCSREELPFAVTRLRGQGAVLDVGAADLRFSLDEVAAWLAARLAAPTPELASALHETTDGWPVGVRLASEVLASVPQSERPALVGAVATRRGPLFEYVAEEVFAREPPDVQELLRLAAYFEPVTPALCEELGAVDADEKLDGLARRGLVAELPVGFHDAYSLHALVRGFIRKSRPIPVSTLRELRRRAGRWYESEGRVVDALAELSAAQDADGVMRLLSSHWRDFVEGGNIDAVLNAAADLPASARRGRGAFVVAQAYIMRAAFEDALEWLAESDDDHSVAFHTALIHINRGESRKALDALLAGPGVGEPMTDAFISQQLLDLGRFDEARGYADRAARAVRHADELTPRAEVSMQLSNLAELDGDPGAALHHAREAVEVAERAGNVLAGCGARIGLADKLAVCGRFAEAVAEATRAMEIADRIGASLFQGRAPYVRGRAELARGRLDEASVDFASGLVAFERLRSYSVAEPLVGIGAVHRERGQLAQARSSYERALEAADRSGAIWSRADARSGLARVLVDDEPGEARRLADEAVEVASPRERAGALLALGWIALHLGDDEAAARAAEAARAEAGRAGTPAALAEALELRGAARGGDPPSLEEARALWQTLENPLGAARVTVALARVGAATRPEADRAESVLRAAGVRVAASGAGLLATVRPESRAPLAIETLGRFRVLRDGAPVAASAWQSKKARDLLKLLVARRGHAVPRDALMEALWPDEDPRKASNRLSVALNVVRNVLEPERRAGADALVVSTAEGVRLDIARVAVDVETFLERADEGLRLLRAGGDADARPVLEAAEAAYAGDFLDEDRYEDWASPLRDEARATYLAVLRALAAGAGRHVSAIRYRLRILGLDQYDEDAHLALVSALVEAGSHGEARRAFRRYVERMGEIGVEPAPFPRR